MPPRRLTVPFRPSRYLTLAAVCLMLAVVAGLLHRSESILVIPGDQVRFSFLHDMTWDAATQRLVRTGSDPHGWFELPGAATPIRKVATEFGGKADPAEGHFYFFQSVTNPVHIGLKMVDGVVATQPGGLRVVAELDNSLHLRLDLPDFLSGPLELRRITIEKQFFDYGSWKVLTMVGAGLTALTALAASALVAFGHRFSVRQAIFWICIISAALRIGVTCVNREAGDDHMKVARIIMEERRLPKTADDWEGFQPKLYHATVALVASALPVGHSATNLVLTGQALSCLAGFGCLWLTYLFLSQLPVSDGTRLWCFAFTALNPKLISIHAQATNDSFVILFGALAYYATTRYLRTGSMRHWLWLTASLCLATLSKASGLVLVAILPAVIVLHLIVRIWRREIAEPKAASTQLAGRLALLVVVFAIVVPVPGQYYQRYRESGTPFATNVDVQPLPHWSKRTYVMRPGIISVRDGFLTFPLRSLLDKPMDINQGAWGSDQIIFSDGRAPEPNGPKAYPFHMVSLWGQLYGGFYFAHFDHWPDSWQSVSPPVILLGKLLMIFCLIPGALWLAGLLPSRKMDTAEPCTTHPTERIEHILAVAGVAAYIAFVAFYAVRIRDYSAMKSIFLFPAWLGIVAVFAQGLERLRRFPRIPFMAEGLAISLGLVCLLGVADVVLLFLQLAAATK